MPCLRKVKGLSEGKGLTSVENALVSVNFSITSRLTQKWKRGKKAETATWFLSVDSAHVACQDSDLVKSFLLPFTLEQFS